MQINIFESLIDSNLNIKNCNNKECYINDNDTDNDFIWFKLYDTNLGIQEAFINTGYEFIWFNLPI